METDYEKQDLYETFMPRVIYKIRDEDIDTFFQLDHNTYFYKMM